MRLSRSSARALAALTVAFTAFFFSIPTVLAEAPAVAPAPYVDAEGMTQTIDTYTSVTDETDTLQSGWYVVDQDVEIKGKLTVNGDAKVVLADGKTLTVDGGVEISEKSTLTLLPQEQSTGKLVAKASGIAAGKDAKLTVPVCVELLDAEGKRIEGTAHAPELDCALTSGKEVVVRPLAKHTVEMRQEAGQTFYVCTDCGEAFSDEAATDRLAQVPAAELEADTTALEPQDEVEGEAPQDEVTAAEDEKTVVITFVANGGSGTMEPLEVKAGVNFVLPECTFTAPEGKEFDRWNLGAVGSSVSVNVSTTAAAQWKDKAGSSIPTTTDANSSTTSNSSTSGSPNTGDTMFAGGIIAVLAVAGLAAIAYGRRLAARD